MTRQLDVRMIPPDASFLKDQVRRQESPYPYGMLPPPLRSRVKLGQG